MSRTIIVPDVHENIPQLDKLLAHAGRADLTVFLGDWFDRFNRSSETTRATIGWLLGNIARPDFTFLWGNHDLPYAFPNRHELMCSGHAYATGVLLDTHPQIWEPFLLLTQCGNILISHAGIHASVFRHPSDAVKEGERAMARLRNRHHVEPAIAAGRSRGGNQRVGGCTWLDWESEFEPIEGVRQIVGHSRGAAPRWKGNSVCIDTDLRFYAVIENDKIEVHEVK